MLESPAIDELSVERAPKRLFHEWLSGYFDGGEHEVGQTEDVQFPRALLAFDQSPIGQPLQKKLSDTVPVEIRVTAVPARTRRCKPEPDGLLVADEVQFNFWVRSALLNMADARAAAEEAADLLHAILANPSARHPLNQKGIMTLRPMKPALVNSTDYVLYLVGASAKLTYAVKF